MSTELTTDMPVVPYAMSHQQSRMVRAEGYDYDHEVLIALPPGYHTSPDRAFPVLWATDGALLFDLTIGILNLFVPGGRVPAMIVVGVGHPSAEGMAGLAKRTVDFIPPEEAVTTGDQVADDYMRELYAKLGLEGDPTALYADVKGDRFLSFLIDQLRPSLAKEYRMADDHTLFGHSGGAMFGSYALFERPGGFSRYVLGSCVTRRALELEDIYAQTHDDLDAKVFISAGELEANNLALSAIRGVSRTVLLAENLLLRQYPSLALKTRLYTDTDHFDIIPRTLCDGLKFVFAEEAAALTSPVAW
jgi:predicted alpha/beta superfamily hydrolase